MKRSLPEQLNPITKKLKHAEDDDLLCAEELSLDENTPPKTQVPFFKKYEDFFCCKGLDDPLENTINLEAKLDEYAEIYSCDLFLLRKWVREHIRVENTAQITPDQLAETITLISQTPALQYIVNFAAATEDKIKQGIDGMIDSIITRWQEYKNFLLAPLEDNTKAGFAEFIKAKEAGTEEEKKLEQIKLRFIQTEEEFKNYFNEEVKLEYYKSMTGRPGYGLTAMGERGLFDDNCDQLALLLKKCAKLTIFFYENRHTFAELSIHYNQFILQQNPHKFMEFLEEDFQFDFFEKLCSPDWKAKLDIEATRNVALTLEDKLALITELNALIKNNPNQPIEVDIDRGILPEFISNCYELTNDLKDSRIQEIMTSEQKPKQKKLSLQEHLQNHQYETKYLVDRINTLRELKAIYQAQKNIHFKESSKTPPSSPTKVENSKLRLSLFGGSPLKATPPRARRETSCKM